MPKGKSSFWKKRRREAKEGEAAAEVSEAFETQEEDFSVRASASADLPDVPAFAPLKEAARSTGAEPGPSETQPIANGNESTSRESRAFSAEETTTSSSEPLELSEALAELEGDDDEIAPVVFGILPPEGNPERGGRDHLQAVPSDGSHSTVGAKSPIDEATVLTPPPDSEVSSYFQESLGSLEAEPVTDPSRPEAGVTPVGWRDDPEHWESEEETWKEITAEWAREDSSDTDNSAAIDEPDLHAEPDPLVDEPFSGEAVTGSEDIEFPPDHFDETPLSEGDVEGTENGLADQLSEGNDSSGSVSSQEHVPETEEKLEVPDGPLEAPQAEAVKSRNLPVAVITGIVFGAIALGLLLAGPGYFAFLAFAVIIVAEIEFVNAVRKSGFQPAAIVMLLGTLLTFVATAKQGRIGAAFGLVAVLLSSTLWYTTGVIKTSPIANLASTIFGFVYLGVAGAIALVVMGFPDPPTNWRVVVTFPLAIAIGSDVAGYLGGKRFGKHFVARTISPHKSLEGYVFGLGVALLVATTFGAVGRIAGGSFAYWTFPKALVASLVVYTASALGDLSESLLKRSLGLKDMSSILPGHGGMLDRIDSLLAAVPAFAVFLYFAGV